MSKDAFDPALCLDVGMRKIPTWFVIVAGLTAAGPAVAYDGRWLVVEDVATQTCYRMTELPDGKTWRQLGDFNTFRQAGMWIWEHRGGVCQSSPVFG
jgi:hypothetical protein